MGQWYGRNLRCKYVNEGGKIMLSVDVRGGEWEIPASYLIPLGVELYMFEIARVLSRLNPPSRKRIQSNGGDSCFFENGSFNAFFFSQSRLSGIGVDIRREVGYDIILW